MPPGNTTVTVPSQLYEALRKLDVHTRFKLIAIRRLIITEPGE